MVGASLFLGVVTSCAGFAAWQYGRRVSSARHLILGFALMGYSWFFDDLTTSALIGGGLFLLLFFPRR